MMPIIPPAYCGPYWYRYINAMDIPQGGRHIAEVESSDAENVNLLLPLRDGYIPDVIEVQVGALDFLDRDILLMTVSVDYTCHDGVTPAKPTRVSIQRHAR